MESKAVFFFFVAQLSPPAPPGFDPRFGMAQWRTSHYWPWAPLCVLTFGCVGCGLDTFFLGGVDVIGDSIRVGLIFLLG